MKLKSPPPPSDLPAATPRATGAAVAKVQPHRAQSNLAPTTAAPESLSSVVRQLHVVAGPADAAPHVVKGTPICETQVEGVRYILVRCAPPQTSALLSLSPRERDIVNLIIKGYPNKTIAELLDISAWTVGTHLRRIFAKLGVTSRAAMVGKYLHQVDG